MATRTSKKLAPVESVQIEPTATVTEPAITLVAVTENPVASDTVALTVIETVTLPPVTDTVIPEHITRDFDVDIESALTQYGEHAEVLHSTMCDLIEPLAGSPVSAIAK